MSGKQTAPGPLTSIRTDTRTTQHKQGPQIGTQRLHGKCRRCGWAVTLTHGHWRHDYTLQALVCAVGMETP